jgi:hypothetical protein
MAEEQAFDRVHRLGQAREVIVIRYIVRDSIEEVSYRAIPEMPENNFLINPVHHANSKRKIEPNPGVIW